ncbi:leukosialin [Carlito syrichta]|uniref:Leukosialin n=1 Tax=Carlito syrichta TaxID=1868482 RepID=A0A3Q0EFA2_CARSF|nr:leukosialin [Carlito syrichta]
MAWLLFFFWALVVTPNPTDSFTSPVSDNSETLIHNSMTSPGSVTRDSKVDNTGDQISTSVLNQVSPLETSTGASTGPPIPGTTTFQEASFITSSMLSETSNAISDPVPTTTNSPESHTVMDGTTANSFNGSGGPPVAMTASSQETTSGTSELPVTMATRSLETSYGTSESPITMATHSLETPNGTSGHLVTMATESLESSSGTSVSIVKIVSMATSKTSTSTSPTPTSHSHQGSSGMLPVAVLVALLVVIVLVALLLLWRRRQKRRTGALTLNRGGKRNGVVDAWAGPAQVPEEGAVTVTVGGSGGNKDSGDPVGEGLGQRPSLTTFFSRRKSRQGSLALEELKSGSSSSLKGEEEPLVGSENEAVEAASCEGPKAGDETVPRE